VSESFKELKLQVGGTLDPKKHLYISRKHEEDDLCRFLNEREYCNVIASRQVGKSSLVTFIMERLELAGNRVAYCDISGEIGGPPNGEDWYQGLLRMLTLEFGLDIDINEWWKEQSGATANQKLMHFFEDVLLKEIESPVVIIMDEIDFSLNLPYTDDFFVAIRTMYNTRSRHPLFERLTFCLVGVATPTELIKSQRTTPYNIGKSLQLSDFEWEPESLKPLINYLSTKKEQGEALLERIFHWTSGHPFLTVWMCEETIQKQISSPDKIDRLAKDLFDNITKVSNHPHFERIITFLDTRISDKLDAYDTYEQVLKGKKVQARATPTHITLKLAGLVKIFSDGYLHVRNRIYERIFNLDWVNNSKPKLTVRNLKRFAFAASFVILLFIGLSFYNMMILEPPRKMAAELENQITQASDINEAQELYQYLVGKEPYPPLRHNPLLGKYLSDFEDKAQAAMNVFWKRNEGESAKNWLIALENTSNETDAKRYFAILTGSQKDPNLDRYLKGDEERAKETIRAFWQKRARSLEQRALARLEAEAIREEKVKNVDEGILWGMLAALKRNGELHPKVKEAYQKGSYNGLIATVRASFRSSNGKQVVYRPDSMQIVAPSNGDKLFIIEPFTGEIIKNFKNTDFPHGVCFWPDGKKIAVGSESVVEILNIGSGKITIVDKGLEHAFNTAYSPLHKGIITYNNGSKIIIRDIKTNKIVQIMEMDSIVFSIDFSPDGKHLLSTDINGGSAIWNVETGAKKLSLTGHTDLVVHGRFSPNGQMIATASIDETARIWDTATGKELKVFEFNSFVYDVTFSSDSQYLLIGTSIPENNIAIYEVKTGKKVLSIETHRGPVLNLAFAPDGKTFASRSGDDTLRIWDAGNLTPEYFSKPPSGSPQEMWKAIQQKLCLSVDENDEIRPLWPEGFSEQDGWTGEAILPSVKKSIREN
jgi:hypothetical protein